MLIVSDLSWNLNSEETYSVMANASIKRVECVFSKIDNWENLTDSKIYSYKNKIEHYGLTPYSAQSLFYGINTSLQNKEKIIEHFDRLIYYSKILKLKFLVFGSPNLRKVSKNWENNLVQIFKTLDDKLENTGIKILIEPNAKVYGGEFFNTLPEIVNFIKKHKFNNIGTMFDLHNIELELFDPVSFLKQYINSIEHVHISEQKLLPLQNYEKHKLISKTLKELNYSGGITYEVVNSEATLKSIPIFAEIYS